MRGRIPVYEPWLTAREKELGCEAIESGWISSKGEYVECFERDFAHYVGLKYGVATSSGTTALHTALLSLGIGGGDEVIVPGLTFIATANAVTYTGAKPVFADSRESDWNACTDSIQSLISEKTKAIVAVHLYGFPCDISEMRQIADAHGLFLIEDCAEATGTQIGGSHVGILGDVSCFSFYGNKTLTTGEGGMLLSSCEEVAETARSIRGQGLVETGEYWHDRIGYNYRMTNVAAAIGVAQLSRVDEILEQKRRIFEFYKSELESRVLFQEISSNARSSYWMVCVQFESTELKDKARKCLSDDLVETRPVFPPIGIFPMYADARKQEAVALRKHSQGLNLPSSPVLSEEQLDRICVAIKRAL